MTLPPADPTPYSPEPARYDAARVARFDAVNAAVLALPVSLLRQRKLRALLNAIEVQIEDGGDSPRVNDPLFAALAAAVVHQVGAETARPALDAIATFGAAEAERWAQVRAGTLPPVVVPADAELLEHLDAGAALLATRQLPAACDHWLAAWDLVQRLARPELRTAQAFDEHYGLLFAVSNWHVSFAWELLNAAHEQPAYAERVLAYVPAYLALFPDEPDETVVNLRRTEAEALWQLGRPAEGEAVYAALVARYPDAAWAYIGWADQYWLMQASAKDYARGAAILQRALARPSLDDRADVVARLRDLYREWGQPLPPLPAAPAPAPAPARVPAARPPAVAATLGPTTRRAQLGRNAPCWCGSGKKYKHCHLDADARAAAGR